MDNGSNADISNKTFLKSEELADFLNISNPAVYQLIETRQIPFFKLGGGLRFKMEDVMRYSENSRIEPINTQIYERKKAIQ